MDPARTPARSGARPPRSAGPWPLLAVLLLAIGLLAAPLQTWAALPPGNAVTDPAAILRDALPIDQSDLQELQHRLESTSDDLRAKRFQILRVE